VVVAVGRGLRLSTLLHAFTSVSTDSDTLKTLFAPVTGITTLTQLGIAYVVIAVMAGRLRGDRRTQRRLGVILLLGVLRAYLLNERLAIVELLVPIMTALAARASASRSDRVRYAVWLAPLALIPGLVLGFSLFEYSRSYQALGQKTHQSFIAFGAQRLSGYYITAYNNGQLELNAEPTPRPLPYNTLEGLWTAPGVSQLKLYDKLTNFDEPAWFLDQLKQHGNPEFNSPSGLAIPFVELGTAGGLILFVCAGTIIGYAYCRFAEGGRMGLLLYPPLTTGLFELPRYLYWVEGRVMLPLVALAISGLWLGRRRVVAQRPVTTVTTATPELPAAVPA
jgi:hypothetical protein